MLANDFDDFLDSGLIVGNEDVIFFQAKDEEALNDEPSQLIKYSDLVRNLDLPGAISTIQSLVTETLRVCGIETYLCYPVMFNGMKASRHQNWDYGVKCEVLQVGASGWKKGRLRIRFKAIIDFIPDDPSIVSKSPLDEIRQMLDED